MCVSPKAGEPEMKQVDSKTWNWCTHHMWWRLHMSQDCHLGKEHAAQQNNAAPSLVAHQAIVAYDAQIPTSSFAAYASLLDSMKSSGLTSIAK